MSDKSQKIDSIFEKVRVIISSVSGGVISESDLNYITIAGMLGTYVQGVAGSLMRMYEHDSGAFVRLITELHKTDAELASKITSVIDSTILLGEAAKKTISVVENDVESKYTVVQQKDFKIPPEMIN